MTWSVPFQSTDALPALGCGGARRLDVSPRLLSHTGQDRRDIREIESGSIGATNVGRVLGRSGFWLTVLGDFIKGALAVLGALFHGQQSIAALALLFVVIGHIWPMPLHWRGQRRGDFRRAALVYDYRLALAYGATVAILFAITRRMTIPGWWRTGAPFSELLVAAQSVWKPPP